MPARMLPVELGQARARGCRTRPLLVDAEQPLLELPVAVRELAGDEVLRVVAPVAVGADPDLEQGRLSLHHRPVRGGRERPDPLARPDEREAEREVDFPGPARALAVDEAEPLGGSLRLGHPGPEDSLHVLHRRRRDLVREPHPLDLLRRLDRACLREQRRRVLRMREGVEPGLREGRRLAHHPVARLCAERELDADRLVLLGERGGEIEWGWCGAPATTRLVVVLMRPWLGSTSWGARGDGWRARVPASPHTTPPRSHHSRNRRIERACQRRLGSCNSTVRGRRRLASLSQTCRRGGCRRCG